MTEFKVLCTIPAQEWLTAPTALPADLGTDSLFGFYSDTANIRWILFEL